ncbi:MFS transporter [Vibrio sp. 10N.286.49.B3]|uniref:multidrug effflux MFS transporter n=1 Tax=Vibrio sp. 10N.286.49.B3 TaxID=1880855 RepID=UPI000C8645B6|nr:multidrug effflux MFS transporter [Vibrio sp. 10N.286.49.B3]PMH44613.1 MFS transporter [Vibrio sp. 10N.286.49.B3]
MQSSLNWKPILLACLTISIGQLSMGLVFPSLPWIAKDFSISIDEAQLLVAIYLLGFGPSQFIYGPISDAIGRRGVLLAGLILSLIGLLLLILGSHSFNLLILGRFIQGIGTGCCAVLARASIRDSYSGQQLPLALSYIMMVASFTPIVAPVIGGFINHLAGWLAVFITLFSYIAIVWVLLFFLFKETMNTPSKIPPVPVILGNYKTLITSRYFLSFASISWLNFSLVVTTISLMPFIMQNTIGMTSGEYALWALIPTCGLLIGSFISSRVRPIIGTKSMLLTASGVQIISALWLFFAPIDPLMLMLGQFFMVLGNGISLPCSQSQVMLPFKRQAGTAAALSGGAQMIISSLVSMTLLKMGLQEAWQLGIVIGVFAVIGIYNIIEGFKATPPTP